MAVGTVTVSGAFGVNDTAGIKAFLESILTASGSIVTSWRDAGHGGVYIAAMEGAA